jgi:hypothetical protein
MEVDMQYTWKRRSNDGWGCKNLYMGKVIVGGYVHSLCRNPDKVYTMRFALPSMVDIGEDDPEALMQKAESLCDEWLKNIGVTNAE